MATRTKPLVTAATLVSAAAIAVAGTAITPGLNQPTPHALSTAKVQLATFADVLSIPAEYWTDVLFCGNLGCNATWGGRLGPESYGPEWAKPGGVNITGQVAYKNPWAQFCDNGCVQTGIPGVAYLFLDALINGDGNGWDPADPGANWPIGFVNYLWEPNTVVQLGGGSSPNIQYVTEGFSAATWYALQGTLGRAVPALTIPIAAAFWGPTNLTVAYNLALSAVAGLVDAVPGIGPFVGDSIRAYLGDLQLYNSEPPQFYQYGLSGTLNYWIDIATGAAPWPTTPPLPTAGAAAVKAVAPAADAEAPAVDEVANDTATADVTATPGDTKAESVTESVVSESGQSDGAATEAEAPENTAVLTSVADVKTAVADTAQAPAKAAPKRPIRDAVQKATKQIAAAVDNAKAKAAAKAEARSSAAKARVAKAAAGS